MKTSIKIKTDMASLVQAVSDLQRLTLKLAEENSLLAERLRGATAFVELHTGHGVRLDAPSYCRPAPWAAPNGVQYDAESIARNCRAVLDGMALQ